MQVPTFCKRQILVKSWLGCMSVSSGMVTSIGLPGAAWSQRLSGVEVDRGGFGVEVTPPVGVGVAGVSLASWSGTVGVVVEPWAVSLKDSVRRASTVW